MTNPFDLTGHVALVTGAGRDMGSAIAIELGRAGANVVVNYATSRQGAKDTVAAIESFGRRSIMVEADVTDRAAAEALIDKTVDFGDGHLEVLVNNAGGLVKRASLVEIDPSLLESSIALNFTSAVTLSQAAIPGMATRGFGRVVNIGSVAAHNGGAVTAHHYAAAKAALTSLGRSLTKEFAGRGVTINTVAPGLIDNAFHEKHTSRDVFDSITKTIPVGRAGTDLDVAYAVVFLASPASAYISGETIAVNGGMYFS